MSEPKKLLPLRRRRGNRSLASVVAIAALFESLDRTSVSYAIPGARATSRRELLLLSAAPVAVSPSATLAFEIFGKTPEDFARDQLARAPAELNKPPADALTTRSGLKYRILKPADRGECAKPTFFDKVIADYRGYESNGRIYEDTYAKGKKAKFEVSSVIRGFSEGLQLMCPGDIYRFWIPADLAYGDGSTGINFIPGKVSGPAGELLLDVKLFEVERKARPPPTPKDVARPPPDANITSSGLASKILQKGNGTATAKNAAKAKVTYSAWTAKDGQLFEASVLKDDSGGLLTWKEGDTSKGLWEGIRLMAPGEKRRFWIPADLAFGKTRYDGGPAGMLVYDLKLDSFEDGFFR